MEHRCCFSFLEFLSNHLIVTLWKSVQERFLISWCVLLRLLLYSLLGLQVMFENFLALNVFLFWVCWMRGGWGSHFATFVVCNIANPKVFFTLGFNHAAESHFPGIKEPRWRILPTLWVVGYITDIEFVTRVVVLLVETCYRLSVVEHCRRCWCWRLLVSRNSLGIVILLGSTSLTQYHITMTMYISL